MASNTSNDILNLIKSLSLSERLKIAEEILRNIREENMEAKAAELATATQNGPAILSLAGIMNEEEARIWDSAIAESRKIDEDEW
ncbi:MAG: hypothetical protein KDC66_18940 [Phaeodactylibacter sp.]|nr:hypothetical protein [Phaeodactylibacter sp.]MCB9273745.1 hypothetical protein [Lewinellaceae bacterium]